MSSQRQFCPTADTRLVVTTGEVASSLALKMKPLPEEPSGGVIADGSDSSALVVPGSAHPLAHLPTRPFTR